MGCDCIHIFKFTCQNNQMVNEKYSYNKMISILKQNQKNLILLITSDI